MPLLTFPWPQILSADGSTYPGAKLFFYETGTSTPATTYTDAVLTTPHTNPVIADATGVFPPIYLANKRYKAVLKTAGDVTLFSADPISGNGATSIATIADMTAIPTPTNGSSVTVTDADRGGLFVFETSATSAADNGTTFKADDATSGSWVRQYSGAMDVRWFGAACDGVTDDAAAIQAAIDAAEAAGRGVVEGHGVMRIASGLTISESHVVFDLNQASLFADFDTGWAVTVGIGTLVKRRCGIRNGYVYTTRSSTALNGIRFNKNTRYQTVYQNLMIEGFKGTGMEFLDLCWSTQAPVAPIIRQCGVGLIVENNTNAITLAGIGVEESTTYNVILRGVVSATFLGGYNQFAGTAGLLIEDGTIDTMQSTRSVSIYGTYFEDNGANHIVARDGRGLTVSGCFLNGNSMTAAAIKLENWIGASIHGNTPVNMSAGTQRDFVEADADCTLIDVGYQYVNTGNDVQVCVQAGSVAGLINGAIKRYDTLPTPNILTLGTVSLLQGTGDEANRASPWIVTQPASGTFEYRRIELSPVKQVAQSATSPYTPTINTRGIFDLTVPDTGLTINAPSGDKADGDQVQFLLRQNATGGGAITWNSVYATDLSNTGNTANTFASATFRWSAGRSKWIQVGKMEWTA